MPEPRAWHVHLGAHKTATTHLQDALADRRDALADRGVFFLPRETFRGALTYRDIPLPPLLRLKRRLRGGARDEALLSPRYARARAAAFRTELESRAGAATRIVISEEQLLGAIDEVFTGDYFAGSLRLSLLSELARGGVALHLFLSLRALDGFLPSAYAQALRSVPAGRLDLPGTLARAIAAPPSWADLAAHILARIPRARLTVWDYADYADHALEIQGMVAGLPLAPAPTAAPAADPAAARPDRTRSPGAEAIRLAETVAETLPRRRRPIVEEIYARHPADGPETAFRPIDPAGRARLRAAHAADLDRLAAMPGIHLRRFDTA
jgi:hypothetical protein